MPIVSPNGFQPVPQPDAWLDLASTEAGNPKQVTVSPDTVVAELLESVKELELIRITFLTHTDGRGFSLARRLRQAGYTGHLRAVGHLISDQFRHALDCGFDDVEINDEIALRQPEMDWIGNFSQRLNYRDQLRGRTNGVHETVSTTDRPYQSQDGIFEPIVTNVEHYSDHLFSFRITRPASFRHRSGEFAMIGLPNAAKPVFRAYSIASPAWADELEFYSIKVPGGPLTENLKEIRQGDTILLKKKATGTLVLDALLPGRRLFLFSTGTGIAPFASVIRDPEAYEKFDQIVLTQTCRTEVELAYGRRVVAQSTTDPLVSHWVNEGRLLFQTTLTRAPHAMTGRITTMIENGRLFTALDIDALDPARDRAMICGSLSALKTLRSMLQDFGFAEGSNARPGDYVVERAYVD